MQQGPSEVEKQLTNSLDSVIGEFHSIDPYGIAFRYSENRDGTSALNFNGVERINLKVFREVVDKIAEVIGGAITHIGTMNDNMKNDFYGD